MTEKTNEIFPEIPASKKFSLKRHRGVVLFLLTAVIILGGFYCFWRFLERPALGTIHPGIVPKVPESFAASNEVKRYVGKYVDFSYAAVYAEKRHEIPESGPVKESIFLSVSDFEGRKIAVTIEDRGSVDFEASPSFYMRLNKPKEYGKEAFSENGFRGFFFAKKMAVFEQDVFFFDKGLLITLAVSSPTTMDGLRDDAMSVFQSMKVKVK